MKIFTVSAWFFTIVPRYESWPISLLAVHPMISSTVRSDPRCAQQKNVKKQQEVSDLNQDYHGLSSELVSWTKHMKSCVSHFLPNKFWGSRLTTTVVDWLIHNISQLPSSCVNLALGMTRQRIIDDICHRMVVEHQILPKNTFGSGTPNHANDYSIRISIRFALIKI